MVEAKYMVLSSTRQHPGHFDCSQGTNRRVDCEGWVIWSISQICVVAFRPLSFLMETPHLNFTLCSHSIFKMTLL